MVHVFAKNQTLVCFGAGSVTIYTDPVPLGESDRLCCMSNVHSLETNSALGSPQLDYKAQLSNDGGQNWVDSLLVMATLSAPGVSKMVGAVNAALLRFQYEFSNPAAVGTDVAAICFDLHVDFEKA